MEIIILGLLKKIYNILYIIAIDIAYTINNIYYAHIYIYMTRQFQLGDIAVDYVAKNLGTKHGKSHFKLLAGGVKENSKRI